MYARFPDWREDHHRPLGAARSWIDQTDMVGSSVAAPMPEQPARTAPAAIVASPGEMLPQLGPPGPAPLTLPLHRAIGNTSFSRLVVQRRGRANLSPTQWLWKAMRALDPVGVERAIQAGGDVDSVDDDGRPMVDVALELVGHRPTTAVNGRAVLDLLLARPPTPGQVVAVPVLAAPFEPAAARAVNDEAARALLFELLGSVAYFNHVRAGGTPMELLRASGLIDSRVTALEVHAQQLKDAIWGAVESLRLAVAARQAAIHELLAGMQQGTGGGGGRGDRHKSYEGVNPSSLLAGPELQTYNAFVAQNRAQGAGKTQQEGWSAVGARRADPNRFSRIAPFEQAHLASFQGHVHGDVEYWDNDGNPWDQKTAYWDHNIPVQIAMEGVVDAIAEQQEVQFPKRGKNERTPVGVILDCTYVEATAYGVLWRLIHEAAEAGRIDINRLVEVRVAEIQASGPKTHIDPMHTDGVALNVRKLELWAQGGNSIPYTTIQKHCSVLDNVINGHGVSWSLYRNLDGQLPAGHVYEEHSTGQLLPNGNKARFVYAPEAGLLYVTGTHYHQWIKQPSGLVRPGFYQVTGAPVRP